MSYKNFIKALELAKNCKGYETLGTINISKVEEAEQLLSIKFSKQNREYYHNVGNLYFRGSEFYGISNREFVGLPCSNAVLLALSDRKEYGLKKEWIPIYFFDDGYMGYLDYSQLNEDGEPPVIMAINNGKEYIVVEKVANDLGDFILAKVEERLKYQQTGA